MHKEKNGIIVYENLRELLSTEILFVTEYEGFYYIKLKPYCDCDNSIWKVDKQTGKASYMMYTEYLRFADKAKEIDPATLRRGA